MIRVLVVDPNEQTRLEVGALCCETNGVKLAGLAADGAEAMTRLSMRNVDVVITELIMPRVDGIALLEHIQAGEFGLVGTVVLTGLGHESYVSRAAAMGVRHYMMKPYDPRLLLERVREAAGALPTSPMPTQPSELQSIFAPPLLEDRISGLFLSLGIPAHIHGYQYLRDAVLLVIEKQGIIGGITKELYPSIARRNATTSSKVERAIRHAIEVAWNRGRVDVLNDALGCHVAHAHCRPSNGEFIALLADRFGKRRLPA